MGKIAAETLARGDGWSIKDVVCTAGPGDRPYEERHDAVSIAVVLEGSFQYRSERGSDVLSPGSLLLGGQGRRFECSHEHGVGDRCVAFHYAPEFFERAGAAPAFAIQRVPPLAALAPWVVDAGLAIHAPERAPLEEMAHGLAGAVLEVLETTDGISRAPAADERRISAALRYVEANLGEALPLNLLAATARMSEFHFVRVFRKVTGVTPHQYILRARLREAAIRLRTSGEPVLQTALEVGFQDLSNFHHAFRAEFGFSPRAYRRSTA
ncbi:MAG: helix-turn-helix transcriptional regulator [Bryobacteraceae bacterium]|nr:helix-turn-helix transcriptional regulator [Bryobacteraceae bacterium]